MRFLKILALIGFCGLVMLSIALLCLDHFLEYIVEKKITKFLELRPGSEISNIVFGSSNSSTNLIIWLFTITNPDKVNGSVKPIMKAVGPYTYRVILAYENVSWPTDTEFKTVSYWERKRYIFDPERSVGDPEKDKIISARLSHLVISEILKDFQPNPFIQPLAGIFLKPFIQISVHEFLWGYTDNLVRLYQKLQPEMAPKSSRIGLFAGRNNSLDGPFLVSTGVGNISRVGTILSYKNRDKFNIWNGSDANTPNGSALVLLAPNMKLGTSLDIYGGVFCRSLPFQIVRKEKSALTSDFELYTLDSKDYVFLDAKTHPPNGEYRAKVGPDKEVKPLLRGLMDMSSCLGFEDLPVPFYISRPFFNKAASQLADSVDYLRRIPINADFSCKIDPKTGVMLDGNKNFQLNMFVTGYKNRGNFEILPNDVYLPIAYINEKGTASKETLEVLYESAYRTPETIRIVITSLLALSLVNCFVLYALGLMRLLNVHVSLRKLIKMLERRDVVESAISLNYIENEEKNSPTFQR